MKTIKNATAKTNGYKVGDKVHWIVSYDDGRGGETCKAWHGTIVKVNRTTVDVETETGNVVRGYPGEFTPGVCTADQLLSKFTQMIVER